MHIRILDLTKKGPSEPFPLTSQGIARMLGLERLGIPLNSCTVSITHPFTIRLAICRDSFRLYFRWALRNNLRLSLRCSGVNPLISFAMGIPAPRFSPIAKMAC